MTGMLSRPTALLLDFGGVLVDAPSLPPAPVELVERLHRLVDGAVPADRIARALIDGARAYAFWRDSAGNRESSTELSHVQVWDDFVTGHWPATARDVVRREATPLSYAWTRRPEWALRTGIVEVLDAAAADGMPVAVVSNTLCGAAHRDFLATAGLADRFAAQLYSDEAGVRKPNPELALRAARAIGVPIEQCWFVGDSRARDIGCARRAGAGAAVLMRSARTDREGQLPGTAPDVVVADGHGLVQLLASVSDR
jgi:HAD superfamily hydrolase (TIGR01549 family)